LDKYIFMITVYVTYLSKVLYCEKKTKELFCIYRVESTNIKQRQKEKEHDQFIFMERYF